MTKPARYKPLCGGKTRNPETVNEFCTRPAGWGTDHVGQGRCKLHGGAAVIKSGRYSKIIRTRVAELIKEQEDNPDPLNILPELALARALLIDFVERYDDWRDAILAWHASWNTYRRPIPQELGEAFGAAIDEYENLLRENVGEPSEKQLADLASARKLIKYMRGEELPVRPREVLDVSAAIAHANTISQIVKREQDARADNAISRKDLVRVQTEMGKAVFKRLTDALEGEEDKALTILKAIRTDWMEIRVQ
jgi:hypothetical protein